MKLSLERVMADVLRVPQNEITDALTMESLEEWDSPKHMDLIVSIEQNFGVELSFDEIVVMTSVVAIRRVLVNKGVLEKWN